MDSIEDEEEVDEEDDRVDESPCENIQLFSFGLNNFSSQDAKLSVTQFFLREEREDETNSRRSTSNCWRLPSS